MHLRVQQDLEVTIVTIEITKITETAEQIIQTSITYMDSIRIVNLATMHV